LSFFREPVDTSIQHQLCQGTAGYFSAYRFKHEISQPRGIVYDHVHSSGLLEGVDISPVASMMRPSSHRMGL
jgi:hypothetical protein